MSERYKKLYHLVHRLYASHAPVLIESGSLLLEQQSNAMLCQLCFRNIQEKPIKSLRAVVQMLDARGELLGNPVDHRYQDLDLKREEDCGRDVAIVLPSLQAASFTVRVNQVVFADGEVWADANAPWDELPEQYALEDYFARSSDLNRFLRRFGPDCSFAPLESEELWFCTCGAVNSNTEARCHRCGRRRAALLGKGSEQLSPEELEEASFHAPVDEDVEVPRLRRSLILGALAAALVLLGILAFLYIPELQFWSSKTPAAATQPLASENAEDAGVVPAVQRTDNPQLDAYQQALTLLTKANYAPLEDAPGLYESAAKAFEALGDFRDSQERAQECRAALQEQKETLLNSDYEDALLLLEERRYNEAREAFEALDDFRDSADQAREAVYRKALALFRFVDTHELKGVAAILSTDAEKESLVVLPREQMLRLGNSGLRDLEDCFGEDPVRFTAEDPALTELKPLEEATAALFRRLGDYRDSADLAKKLPEMIDRSEDFFKLCAAGELAAAKDWLNAWDRPFEDRELWLERIDRFLPYCRNWEMLVGDPSLVSTMAGSTEKVDAMRSTVLLTRDGAVLRFFLHEGDQDGPELYADLGDSRFLLIMNPTTYLANISGSGSLSLIKLKDGDVTGGVEYRAA